MTVTWQDVTRAADEMRDAPSDEFEYRHKVWMDTLRQYQTQQQEKTNDTEN